MVLYPNKLPESERVCSGICNPQRYYVSYYWLDNLLISLNEVEFIDAAYEMLCWVIDNGYLKFE